MSDTFKHLEKINICRHNKASLEMISSHLFQIGLHFIIVPIGVKIVGNSNQHQCPHPPNDRAQDLRWSNYGTRHSFADVIIAAVKNDKIHYLKLAGAKKSSKILDQKLSFNKII